MRWNTLLISGSLKPGSSILGFFLTRIELVHQVVIFNVYVMRALFNYFMNKLFSDRSCHFSYQTVSYKGSPFLMQMIYLQLSL
jgi:hypothetical protein